MKKYRIKYNKEREIKDTEYNCSCEVSKFKKEYGEDSVYDFNRRGLWSSYKLRYSFFTAYTTDARDKKVKELIEQGYTAECFDAEDVNEKYFTSDSSNPYSPRYSPDMGLINVGTWHNSIHSNFGPIVWTTEEHRKEVIEIVSKNNKRSAEHAKSYYSSPWV